MLFVGCTQQGQQPVDQETDKTPAEEREEIMSTLKIISSAVESKGNIPKQYTCDGENLSPPLEIEGIPEATQSLALIVEDPDALGKTWIHWLVWNIPPQFTKIPQGSPPPNSPQGTNDFGNQSYGGPCPPPGPQHRYFFKIYALDAMLEIEEAASKQILEKAMEGHILAQAELIGLYGRGR